MKLIHPQIDTVFDTENGYYNTLVIENQAFFAEIVQTLYDQIQGADGPLVLSVREDLVPLSRGAALLDRFVPLDLNPKPLLNRVAAVLAQRASAAEVFERTAALLSQAELWLNDLAFDFPCDIVFPGLSVASLIKAAGPELRTDTEGIAEKALDYMELVEEFDRSRLFVTVNMRAYVQDDAMDLFARTVISHRYHVIGLECVEHPRLSVEKRVIIDGDLCEIS